MEPRTDDEIVAYVNERIAVPKLFDFAISDLIAFLPFDKAKQFLRPEGIEEAQQQWGDSVARDEATLRKHITDYLPFAFEKADNQRGLSAVRSLQHFEAWVWMLRDDEALAYIQDDRNYEPYGRPVLEYLQARYLNVQVAA